MKAKDQITWSHIGSFYTQAVIILNISSLFILIIKDFKNRWKHWLMLNNSKVKLIIIS